MILAIDPGTFESGFAVISEDYRPVDFGKIPNGDLLERVRQTAGGDFVIEMVASYGMAVGKEIFETVFWIGRFWEAAQKVDSRSLLYRREEKIMLCGSAKANDANIRQALVDRFAYGVRNCGKGTKAAPGWFYGFRADIWQAYAVGVTWLDKTREAMRT